MNKKSRNQENLDKIKIQTIKKGYKQTEIGVIPEDWEVELLGNLLKFGSGQDYKHLGKGKIPVYGTGGIMTYVDNYLYDGMSVGIGRKGTIDKPVFLKGKFWTVDTLFYTHSFKNTLPEFIYFSFNLIKWKEYNEASGVPSLNKNTLERIQIPLPPTLEEQKAIAQVLSDTDQLIQNLKTLIAKKKAIKQGAMQELLTGKKRLQGFTEEWETKKLGEVLSYEQPPKYIINSDILKKGKTPVLTANKSFVLGYTNEDFGIYTNTPVVIFDDFTTLNKYVNFAFKIKSSAIKILRNSPKYSLQFLYNRMQLIEHPLGDHKRYYISEYQNIEIEVPSYIEQQAIAQILSDMDAEIEALEQQLQKTQTLKQGMMQELLTGKTRLIVNDEL